MARGGYRSRDQARPVRYAGGGYFDWFVRRWMTLEGAAGAASFGRHSTDAKPRFSFMHQISTGTERPFVQILTFADPELVKLIEIPEGYTQITTGFLVPIICSDASGASDFLGRDGSCNLFYTAHALSVLAIEQMTKEVMEVELHLINTPLAIDQAQRITERLLKSQPFLTINVRNYQS